MRRLLAMAGLLALATRATALEVAPIRLTAPLDYQVVQRRTAGEGVVPVAGHCAAECDRMEVRLGGKASDGSPYDSDWQPLPHDAATGAFAANVTAPAGGWYAVEVRALQGTRVVAAATVAHVGVGEVFVGAGQSNSTSCGGVKAKPGQFPLDGLLQPKSGLVATFDGTKWRIADDPQPGAQDAHAGGSFWPAFGDAMAARFKVPIGVAATGRSSSSVKQWQEGEELFQGTLTRLRQLGPNGFRALLWHQGEADNGKMSGGEYARQLKMALTALRRELNRDFPVFVAQASYSPWVKPQISGEIRAGQRQLWQEGVALEGPDTDKMLGDLRDHGGRGIHFSRKGLKVHGEAWTGKVGAWLESQLGRDP